MPKHNLFAKKLKKQFLSVNDSIESYFNKLKFLRLNLKNTKLIENNRAFLILGSFIVLIVSYFLLPSFYNKNLIQSKIENQILKKYNIEIEIEDKIKYGLFPKPHFFTNNSSILLNNKNIAEINSLKIHISSSNFFKFNLSIIIMNRF